MEKDNNRIAYTLIAVIIVLCLFVIVILQNLKANRLEKESVYFQDRLKFERIDWKSMDELPSEFVTFQVEYEGCWKHYEGYLYLINNTNYCGEQK